jgi:hypothetical protein
VLLNNLDSMCLPVEIASPVFGQRTISMPIRRTPAAKSLGKGSAVVGGKDKSPVTIRWLC